ncbi:MAG TPA: IS3 family transposase [Pseudonocardiaceae bacterium]|nr:IS3 family transposase [Pseudonocardiaceae bacterium]
MILAAVSEAQAAGARLDAACSTIGISARTVERWRTSTDACEDGRCGPRRCPPNTLTPAEQAEAVALLTRPEYRGLSPKQLVPQLADQGKYVASESTLYRLMRRFGLQSRRPHTTRSHVTRASTVHHATGPNQVWSWDITYLPTVVRGRFLYLYLVMDVWSRRIVGCQVHERESEHCAAAMVRDICATEQVEPRGLVLHSDNGKPMRGSTMIATLQWLGIVPSFSRPHVSDDNPYSEALFRTLKHTPAYPRLPFASIEAAQRWVADFVAWYNSQHRHSAIRYVTPDQRHYGLEKHILSDRLRVYERARRRRPSRWSRAIRNWSPVGTVVLNRDPTNKNVFPSQPTRQQP